MSNPVLSIACSRHECINTSKPTRFRIFGKICTEPELNKYNQLHIHYIHPNLEIMPFWACCVIYSWKSFVTNLTLVNIVKWEYCNIAFPSLWMFGHCGIDLLFIIDITYVERDGKILLHNIYHKHDYIIYIVLRMCDFPIYGRRLYIFKIGSANFRFYKLRMSNNNR